MLKGNYFAKLPCTYLQARQRPSSKSSATRVWLGLSLQDVDKDSEDTYLPSYNWFPGKPLQKAVLPVSHLLGSAQVSTDLCCSCEARIPLTTLKQS